MLPEYFEFYNPVKLLCGQWSLENIPYELGRLRVKKPLMLVSGTMLQQGILQMIGEPMPMVLESGIPQDSSFELVERLAAHAREEGCDGVVAIGGGSVLDTAKAVRVLLEQEQTALRRLLGSEWMSRTQRVIPFIMVPTTSGTGSECTAVAVVMDEKNGCKQEIISDRFLPDVAVLDPRCTEKLPPRQTAACGMDALVHAMEAYTCRQKNPLSDAYARTAVEMIGKNLIAAVRQPGFAGISPGDGLRLGNGWDGIFQFDVGLVHAIGHALGCGLLGTARRGGGTAAALGDALADGLSSAAVCAAVGCLLRDRVLCAHPGEKARRGAGESNRGDAGPPASENRDSRPAAGCAGASTGFFQNCTEGAGGRRPAGQPKGCR